MEIDTDEIVQDVFSRLETVSDDVTRLLTFADKYGDILSKAPGADFHLGGVCQNDLQDLTELRTQYQALTLVQSQNRVPGNVAARLGIELKMQAMLMRLRVHTFRMAQIVCGREPLDPGTDEVTRVHKEMITIIFSD